MRSQLQVAASDLFLGRRALAPDRDVFVSHWRYLPYGLHKEPRLALEDVPVAIPAALRTFSSAKMLKKSV